MADQFAGGGGMQSMGGGAEGAGAGTTSPGGAPTTSGGQFGGGQQSGQFNGQSTQGGAQALPWESDQRFRGKQAGDVWKSYTELEKKLGGLPEMEKALQQWQQFGNSWKPYLESVGWDPQRLAKALEAAAARQQAAQGGQGGQPQMGWGDALTPEQQERWIGDRFTQFEQKSQQQMQQVATALVDYFNRFGDLAMRAIEQKFMQLPENIRPKIAINDLLQEAVNIATNRYDPLEWAAKIKTAEPQEAIEARIRADERAKVEAELKNRQLTTFSGSGTGSPRTMRPRGPLGNAQAGQPAPRMSEANAISAGRERFVSKWNEIVSP